MNFRPDSDISSSQTEFLIHAALFHQISGAACITQKDTSLHESPSVEGDIDTEQPLVLDSIRSERLHDLTVVHSDSEEFGSGAADREAGGEGDVLWGCVAEEVIVGVDALAVASETTRC